MSTNSSAKSFEETYDSIRKPTSSSSAHEEESSPRAGRKGIDDVEDEEEMEFSMGKLIRQASLNSNSETMRPIKHAAKQATASSSLSGKKPLSRLQTQTSLSTVECQELQGFKKLGFDHSESKRGIISTLRERERREEDGGGKSRLRRTQSWAPPVPVKPGTAGKKSTEEDIKTQIKFWARAVASNVRPE